MDHSSSFIIREPPGGIPEGLVAVVTGAGSGVGEAVARELAVRGARVALVGRRIEKLEAVERSIRDAGGRCQAFPGDVSLIDDARRLKDSVIAAFEPPQVLVNAAGLHCELVPIQESSPAQWKETLDVNLFGCYLTCRTFMGDMIEKGWGRMVNVTSASSLNPPGYIASVYSLSKVALNHFTRQLAAELEGTGVTANVIHPGEVKTEMWEKIKADAESRQGEGKGALRWVRSVERSGGDPPEATAEVVLGLIASREPKPNGQFLWIRDGMKESMPSW